MPSSFSGKKKKFFFLHAIQKAPLALKDMIPLQRRDQQSQLGLAPLHLSFHHFASIDHYTDSTDLSHTLFHH